MTDRKKDSEPLTSDDIEYSGHPLLSRACHVQYTRVHAGVFQLRLVDTQRTVPQNLSTDHWRIRLRLRYCLSTRRLTQKLCRIKLSGSIDFEPSENDYIYRAHHPEQWRRSVVK